MINKLLNRIKLININFQKEWQQRKVKLVCHKKEKIYNFMIYKKPNLQIEIL